LFPILANLLEKIIDVSLIHVGLFGTLVFLRALIHIAIEDIVIM